MIQKYINLQYYHIYRADFLEFAFKLQDELHRLNQLVWPEIARLAEEQIQQYAQGKQRFCALYESRRFTSRAEFERCIE